MSFPYPHGGPSHWSATKKSMVCGYDNIKNMYLCFIFYKNRTNIVLMRKDIQCQGILEQYLYQCKNIIEKYLYKSKNILEQYQHNRCITRI
jgi:hypothetical protein